MVSLAFTALSSKSTTFLKREKRSNYTLHETLCSDKTDAGLIHVSDTSDGKLPLLGNP